MKARGVCRNDVKGFYQAILTIPSFLTKTAHHEALIQYYQSGNDFPHVRALYTLFLQAILHS